MKRRFIPILAITTVILCCSAAMAQTPPERIFAEGVNAYNRGDYNTAADLFLRLAESGIVNHKLFYNLGNVYLKKNDLGRAILWYERADRINPNDPDLRFNLEFAGSKLKDIQEGEKRSIFKILFFWKYGLSAETIQYSAIVLNGFFWTLLAVYRVRRKRASGWVCRAVLIPVVILTATAGYNTYEENWIRQAVILNDSVPVHSGWSDDATELFILNSGTKVTVKKEQNGYYRISFSSDKIGWLKKEAAEII